MKVNVQETDRVTVEGAGGICIQITETPQGNLRVTEIGRYIQTLQVIPQSSNSLILTSSRSEF